MYNTDSQGMLSSEIRDAAKIIAGFNLYRWQQRLLTEFLEGRIPDALDIPTGLGKTSVMALWLTARAFGSAVPRRLFYVVDRRAVVDQATKFAEEIARNIGGLLDRDDCREFRRNLCLGSESLPISTLRGQFADNRLWLEDPTRSSIVVGTVDMIGSRILFEGYGVGTKMRPVHAALVATDSLVVLDEAHLVPPFEALIRSAKAVPRPLPVPAMHVLSLSATGRSEVAGAAFRLTEEEREEDRVASRLKAEKKLRVLPSQNLAQSLADAAFDLGKNGKRVLIFCNSRDKLARQVAADLQSRSQKLWVEQTTALLVGSRRVIEREQLVRSPVFQRFQGDSNIESSVPAFLVATSAGEVGVDLNADHMVCDLVSWERMVQRLGRVNRTGRNEPATVLVYVAAPNAKDDAEQDVTDSLAIYQRPFESPLWLVDVDGTRQAGPGQLAWLKSKPEFAEMIEAATSKPPLHPELTIPLLDAWAMTSLDHHPGRPIVEPWIRGWMQSESQCRVVWRRVLPVQDGKPDVGLLNDFFDVFPPHLSEVLETDVYAILQTLSERAKALLKEPESAATRDLKRLAAVVLDTQGKVEPPLFTLKQLAAGPDVFLADRTIVVDARLGGLSRDGLLDRKSSQAVATLDASEPGVWDRERIEAIGRRLRIVPASESAETGWLREAGWPQDTDDTTDEPTEWRIERKVRFQPDANANFSRTAQGLKQHSEWAVEEAQRLARALGLAPELERMLVEAAGSHDLGKDRELWQTAMGAPREGRPFAKTDGRKANGLALGGYRHEFGSLRDANLNLENIGDAELRDLARHIILSHHGFARPLIQPIDPSQPPSLATEQSIEAAQRFSRLQRKWGAWGLAWWESLLRCADWAASDRASRQNTGAR